MKQDRIEPLIPGNHIQDWQKIRKKQWSSVRVVLEDKLSFSKSDIKEFKKYYISGCESEPDLELVLEPPPLMGMWFSADQSEENWKNIWDAFIKEEGWEFDYNRKKIINIADSGALDKRGEVLPYGAFGGLEQRLLSVYVRSNVYTEETFELADDTCRLIPWKDPLELHSAVLGSISHFFERDKSPFSPFQWMHDLFVSTFDYGIEYNERSDRMCMNRLVSCLTENASDLYHENHLTAGLKLIDILEDDMAPKYLKDLWVKVRDEK